MSDRFKSSSGKPYSEDKWLENHHAIKSRLRAELVQKIDLRAGDSVLDLGCGTGSWTFLIADRVGHRGSVDAIDLDEAALEAAELKRHSHHHRARVKFDQFSVFDLREEHKYDAITAFNSLCYIDRPEVALSAVRRALKSGGRFIAKDSDLGSDFFWPVDRGLYFSLMTAIQERGSSANDDYYDPFFARQLPKLLTECGFVHLDTLAQSCSFVHPVDQHQRTYIAENGRMISDRAEAIGERQLAAQWSTLFDDMSENCIFDSPEFFYTMAEFVFQARTPSS